MVDFSSLGNQTLQAQLQRAEEQRQAQYQLKQQEIAQKAQQEAQARAEQDALDKYNAQIEQQVITARRYGEPVSISTAGVSFGTLSPEDLKRVNYSPIKESTVILPKSQMQEGVVYGPNGVPKGVALGDSQGPYSNVALNTNTLTQIQMHNLEQANRAIGINPYQSIPFSAFVSIPQTQSQKQVSNPDLQNLLNRLQSSQNVNLPSVIPGVSQDQFFKLPSRVESYLGNKLYAGLSSVDKYLGNNPVYTAAVDKANKNLDIEIAKAKARGDKLLTFGQLGQEFAKVGKTIYKPIAPYIKPIEGLKQIGRILSGTQEGLQTLGANLYGRIPSISVTSQGDIQFGNPRGDFFVNDLAQEPIVPGKLSISYGKLQSPFGIDIPQGKMETVTKTVSFVPNEEAKQYGAKAVKGLEGLGLALALGPGNPLLTASFLGRNKIIDFFNRKSEEGNKPSLPSVILGVSQDQFFNPSNLIGFGTPAQTFTTTAGAEALGGGPLLAGAFGGKLAEGLLFNTDETVSNLRNQFTTKEGLSQTVAMILGGGTGSLLKDPLKQIPARTEEWLKGTAPIERPTLSVPEQAKQIAARTKRGTFIVKVVDDTTGKELGILTPKGKGGLLESPGGGINPGESILKGSLRELYEELIKGKQGVPSSQLSTTQLKQIISNAGFKDINFVGKTGTPREIYYIREASIPLSQLQKLTPGSDVLSLDITPRSEVLGTLGTNAENVFGQRVKTLGSTFLKRPKIRSVEAGLINRLEAMKEARDYAKSYRGDISIIKQKLTQQFGAKAVSALTDKEILQDYYLSAKGKLPTQTIIPLRGPNENLLTDIKGRLTGKYPLRKSTSLLEIYSRYPGEPKLEPFFIGKKIQRTYQKGEEPFALNQLSISGLETPKPEIAKTSKLVRQALVRRQEALLSGSPTPFEGESSFLRKGTLKIGSKNSKSNAEGLFVQLPTAPGEDQYYIGASYTSPKIKYQFGFGESPSIKRQIVYGKAALDPYLFALGARLRELGYSSKQIQKIFNERARAGGVIPTAKSITGQESEAIVSPNTQLKFGESQISSFGGSPVLFRRIKIVNPYKLKGTSLGIAKNVEADIQRIYQTEKPSFENDVTSLSPSQEQTTIVKTIPIRLALAPSASKPLSQSSESQKAITSKTSPKLIAFYKPNISSVGKESNKTYPSSESLRYISNESNKGQPSFNSLRYNPSPNSEKTNTLVYTPGETIKEFPTRYNPPIVPIINPPQPPRESKEEKKKLLMKRRAAEQGYLVFTKKSKKPILISSAPLPKGEALYLGRKATKDSLRATFYLVPTRQKAVERNLPRITENDVFRSGYRLPIKKGRVQPDNLVFIQKRATRLGTRNERVSIQQARRNSIW